MFEKALQLSPELVEARRDLQVANEALKQPDNRQSWSSGRGR
jgi:hypothetical protein